MISTQMVNLKSDASEERKSFVSGPEDWPVIQGFDKDDASESCSSDMKSSHLLVMLLWARWPQILEMDENENIPKNNYAGK